MYRQTAPTYLLKRQTGFYFRIRVPHDLKAHLQLSEIKTSIGLTTRVKGLKIARKFAVLCDSLFDEVRTRPSLWTTARVDTWREQNLKLSNSYNTERSIDPYHTDSSKPQLLLSQLIDKFIKEQVQCNQWTEKTKSENEAIFKLAIRIIGDTGVSNINYDHVRKYKEKLCQLPPNINKIRQYKGLDIDTIIELRPSPMAVNTINKNLNRMSSLFKWSVKHGYMSLNFAESIQLKKAKRQDEERAIYTQEELEMIFSTEIYTQHKYKHAYQFWLPLLGLFTGARLNELCQLYLNDVRQQEGVWIIDINDDSKDKRLKSRSSKRIVALHPTLLSLGFTEFVTRLKINNNERLFPELKKRRDGYAQDASKWFARFRRKIGVSGKDFHSFRHTLSNNLHEHGVSLDIVGEIVGHDNGRVTKRYAKRLTPITQLSSLMKLDYGVNFHSSKKHNEDIN